MNRDRQSPKNSSHQTDIRQGWTFDILSDWEEVFDEKNTDRWLRHVENAEETHVFFHPLLAKIWVKTYRPLRNISPVFVWADNGQGNTVIMPMAIWKRNWKNAFIKTIVPLGHSDYDYHDPIFLKRPSDEEYDSYWDALLNKLAAFGADEIAIDGMVRTSHHREWEETEICPGLNLEEIHNADDLLKFLKPNLRMNIKRRTKRLGEMGELTLREYKSWVEASGFFETFMKAHSEHWPNAYKAPGFHRNILQYGLPTDIVTFSALCIGERPVAGHLGFRFRGRFYYYMTAFDRDLSKLAPASIHLFKLIEDSIGRGLKVYDHLRGDETYKGGWSNQDQYVHHFRRTSPRPLSVLKRTLSDAAHRLSK